MLHKMKTIFMNAEESKAKKSDKLGYHFTNQFNHESCN